MTDPHEFECVVMLARDPVLRRSYDYCVSRMQIYAQHQANKSQQQWVNYASLMAEVELIKLTAAAFRAVGRTDLQSYSQAMTRLAVEK